MRLKDHNRSLGGHPPETKKTRRSTHPVDDVDSPHRAHFGRVIDEADVSLRGSIQLSDFNVAEAVQKLRPDVCSDPIADRDPHFVVLLVVFLQKTTQKSKQRPAKFKSDPKLIRFHFTLGELQR